MAIIGGITMLWGAVLAVLAVVVLGHGFAEPPGGNYGGSGIRGVMILAGWVLLAPSALILLAGAGVLCRKQWGRILTFVVAALFILSGLFYLCTSIMSSIMSGNLINIIAGILIGIAIGALQLLYGILAFVILIMKSAEFARPPA